jgi:serine/threonine-protein kinase
MTVRDSMLALEHLERSAELDPSCALPYSRLAMIYTFLASVGQMDASDAYPRAAAFARHALELEPESGEGHLALGLVKLFHEWDFEGAGEYLGMAVERTPGSPDARSAYGSYLKAVGRLDESVDQHQAAVRVDPLSLPANRALAVALLAAGRVDEAWDQAQRVLKLDERFMAGLETAGFIKLHQGDLGGALELWDRMPEVSGDPTSGTGVRGLALGRLGRREEARALLVDLDRRRSESPSLSLHNDHALVHWGLGELDRTFEYLGRAVDERMGTMIFLATSPNWKPLRPDPRFQALVERIGVPVVTDARS